MLDADCPYTTSSFFCPGDCGACTDVDIGTVADRVHVLSDRELAREGLRGTWMSMEEAKRVIAERREASR